MPPSASGVRAAPCRCSLRASTRASQDKIADIRVVGRRGKITALAKEHGLDLTEIELIDPDDSPLLPHMADALLNLRHKRGMTPEIALQRAREPLDRKRTRLNSSH